MEYASMDKLTLRDFNTWRNQVFRTQGSRNTMEDSSPNQSPLTLAANIRSCQVSLTLYSESSVDVLSSVSGSTEVFTKFYSNFKHRKTFQAVDT